MVVRRVVRGVGSVGSPRSGGQFFQLSQTRDKVEGLHNRREFSQRLECLYQAMQTQEKSFLLLL